MWSEVLHFLLAQVWVFFVLYILFDTDAVYDHCKRIPLLRTAMKLKEYEVECTFSMDGKKPNLNPFRGSYSLYMRTNYGDRFLVRMFSCPLCVGVWLSLAAAAVIGQLELMPCLYFGSLAMLFVWRTFIGILRDLERQDDE